MDLTLNIWRQTSKDSAGNFETYQLKDINEHMSFLEMLDVLNEQLEGESFIINTTATTKCFADTTDPDKIPDLVSCNELDDAANNAPGSIKAQFRGKVTFDDKTFLPTFKAQKIVFLKGVFNVAKIK